MQNWIQIQILENLIQSDVFVMILTLVLAAWLFYKIFLRSVTDERHRNLGGRFGSLFRHTFILIVFYLIFSGMEVFRDLPLAIKFLPYIGFLTVIWGSIVFIQACRIMVLQYLFLTSMRAGVPLLLVNIFTLVLSLFLASWIAASLFGIQLGPLLATSAAFSLILGLALQDTLGNLFAGISLQLDQTFEIDDWLEIISGNQRIIGKVKEITWRAVFLDGLSDEEVIVPNRVIAQSHVFNWTRDEGPIIRTAIYKLQSSCSLEIINKVKMELANRVKAIKGVSAQPGPIVLLSELEGNSVCLKLAFFIKDYGAQNIILDLVHEEAFKTFKEYSLELAVQKFEIKQS
jgi:small-conductance mechanosensitive channel